MADDIQLPAPAGKVLAFKDVASRLFPWSLLADASGNDAMGVVGASPSANTLLGRLKAIADGLVALATVGTRAYGAGQQIAIGAASAATSGINATEVLLHPSVRCFVRVGATATAAAGIPLEAGEKFHLRKDAGQQINVIRDTTDGTLNVVPVA